MHFQSVDRIPDEEFGYWDETLDRWHDEGLPKSVDSNEKADRFFGFDQRGGVPVNLGLIPDFEARVLEETESYRTLVDTAGVVSVVHKDGRSSIPRYLSFPIKSRADWQDFKRRLDPATRGRFVDEDSWRKLKEKWEQRDYPLGIGVGSLFGWLRGWMGFENIAVTTVEQPDWVHEMMEHLTQLIIAVVRRAVEEVDLDFASMWEDMCFKNGPMISPAMFSQFMVPRLKRITRMLRSRGCDVVIVDCDGNIHQLVPLWLEAGVNVMFPLEVAAGTDALLLRKLYGRDVLLLGGVDKKALIAGPRAIDEELARIAPLVEQGGFIPHVDHRVPADVSYRDYLYYLRAKRKAFGIPQKEPGEGWTES
jgi:uroporphyrinogen decarboxylase